jgi:hypothetical protein
MHHKGTSFGAPALIFFAIHGVSQTRLTAFQQKKHFWAGINKNYLLSG